jgi:hypothetical protein
MPEPKRENPSRALAASVLRVVAVAGVGGFLLFAPAEINVLNWLSGTMDDITTRPGLDGRSVCDDLWKHPNRHKGGSSTWWACERLARENGTLDQYRAHEAKREMCLKWENLTNKECEGIRQ